MVKNYKVGDKLICLKDMYYIVSVIFSAGKYYTISHVGEVYYIIDNVSFFIEKNKVCSLNEYFGTLKQYRKLKLEKLKTYGRYNNIQSML